MSFKKYCILILYLFNSSIDCFSIFGHRNVMNYLMEEMNKTLTLSDDPVSRGIEEVWIEQPLDHFNEQDNRTWKMRYLQRLDMWKADGPIYLIIGGEGEIRNQFLLTGTTYELAKETNGAMFLSEHRYYGKSQPFDQFTTENLKYLSARQALGDLASLLIDLKSKPEFAKSKVVAVGGSYAGNLAAWVKLFYPNLIDAAIASSGPVESKVDFYEYLEIVSDDFEQYGSPGCYEKIEKIFKEIEEKFKTEAGIKELKKEENICDKTDMTKPLNKQLFFSRKISYFQTISQYGDVNRIKEYCGQLNGSYKVSPEYEKNDLTWNECGRCYDNEFNTFIGYIKDTLDMKAWTYQTCTEFGYYQSTTSNKHPFTNNVPVEFYFKMCTDLFGKDFDEKRVEDGVKKTNEMYGGLHPNVSKVVFVNGKLDPWHRLSILEDLTNEAPAKLIQFSSHCKDLFSDKEGDPEELKDARRYVKSLVKEWIGTGEFADN